MPVMETYFKQIFHRLLAGNCPDYTIDYSRFELSKGSAALIFELFGSILQTGVIQLKWIDERSYNRYDNLYADMYFFVLNESNHKVEIFREVPYTFNCEYQFQTSNYTPGDKVHCWMMLRWDRIRKVSAAIYVDLTQVMDV